jgi:hypothetical protein
MRLPCIPVDETVICVPRIAQNVAPAMAQGVAQSVAQVDAYNFAHQHVIFPDNV